MTKATVTRSTPPVRAAQDEYAPIPGYAPGGYDHWRHGGWYTNVQYPSGAWGCVSRNFADRKWRIVCDDRDADVTYPNRDAATIAEARLAGYAAR